MHPLSDAWGSESKPSQLNSLFQSRFKLALCALIVQLLAILPIIKPFMFTGLFNIPAILALLLCVFKRNLSNYQAQKKIKLLLKIGVAKAVGGVCLALYMGLKYAYMPSTSAVYGHYGHSYMKMCALYFAASALVDIFYAYLAKDILQITKQIGSLLKEKKKQRSPRSPRSPKSTSSKQLILPEETPQAQEP